MLSLKPTADLPYLEAESLRPDAFLEATVDDVRRHPLSIGNQLIEAGALFTIEGDPSDGRWHFEGDLPHVHRLGEQMTAGEIHIEGTVGDRLGAQMRGGRITVRGDAGEEVGTHMRRGLITIHGNAGDLAGYRLRAGTLLLLSGHGPRVGLEMKRGTIGLFGEQPFTPPPNFRYACDFEPAFLPLLTNRAKINLPRRVALFNGDLLCGGRGEVLVPAA